VPQLNVLRVFVNDEGEFGNGLGVFLDGGEIAADKRQAVAADLGFAETVFVDDRDRAEIRIFTPAVELPFAGHPTVGTAWLLRETGATPELLRPPAGEIGVRFEDGATFVDADPSWSPPFQIVELDAPAAVRELDGPPASGDEVYAWSWIDEDAGTIRARSFAPGVGIPEDEATGSAALALSARLGRSIVVNQGKGSILVAGPLGEARAEVGGAVVLDEVRDYRLMS
jgi:predicted PhzF superfamily epimerase YddE/YHI9